jgi:hypothetical protein
MKKRKTQSRRCLADICWSGAPVCRNSAAGYVYNLFSNPYSTLIGVEKSRRRVDISILRDSAMTHCENEGRNVKQRFQLKELAASL